MPLDPNPCVVKDKPLGKLPARGHPNMLLLSDYLPTTPRVPPEAADFWYRRTRFPARTFGNRNNGCCTRASQAVLAMRMERIEANRTAEITDEEVLRVYYEMTQRLYGGGDTGAYEMDALSSWRRKDETFKDTKGRPLTIDAYTRINHLNVNEVKYAIWTAGAKGIKICLALPKVFASIDPPKMWDLPEGQALTGDWMPGSWGGHSLTVNAYTKQGVRLVHTWYEKDDFEQLISWRAFAAYCDESYLVVDSVDEWRRKATGKLNLRQLVKDVNDVSSTKLKRYV